MTVDGESSTSKLKGLRSSDVGHDPVGPQREILEDGPSKVDKSNGRIGTIDDKPIASVSPIRAKRYQPKLETNSLGNLVISEKVNTESVFKKSSKQPRLPGHHGGVRSRHKPEAKDGNIGRRKGNLNAKSDSKWNTKSIKHYFDQRKPSKTLESVQNNGNSEGGAPQGVIMGLDPILNLKSKDNETIKGSCPGPDVSNSEVINTLAANESNHTELFDPKLTSPEEDLDSASKAESFGNTD